MTKYILKFLHLEQQMDTKAKAGLMGSVQALAPTPALAGAILSIHGDILAYRQHP